MIEASSVIEAIGSFATAGTLVFAVIVYKRGEEKEAFVNIRASLSRLNIDVFKLQQTLSEAQFSKISESIVRRLWEWKGKTSAKVFFERLQNKEYHDHIAQVIHVGRLESGLPDKVEDLVSCIRQVPSQYNESLPVISIALDKFVFYVTHTAMGSISPRMFDHILGNQETVRKNVIPNLKRRSEADELVFTEMVLLVGAGPTVWMESHGLGQKVFEDSAKCIRIITDTFSGLSDAELKKAGEEQREILKSNKIGVCEHAAEEALNYLNLISGNFEKDDFQEIVMACARIIKEMTPSTGREE